MRIVCLNCGRPYPEEKTPHKCPICGGLYDYLDPLIYGDVDPNKFGVWRYASSIDQNIPPVSLGEGDTPLLSANAFGRKVFFKCEYANPTGSFKDRGTTTLVSYLRSRGVTEAIEDSSGNAGASFAAYTARAGIKARVFVPEAASGPKRKQIEMYGAELVTVPGPRSRASEEVQKEADGGMVYASHAYMPFNIPGYATCAYEIFEQLGKVPGAVMVPAGQGGLLLGIGRGFQSLLIAGMIPRLPVIIGVQASVCAPLTALSRMGLIGLNFITEGTTLAEGVRVLDPLRANAVLKVSSESAGRFVAVDEEFILSGRDALAHLGFYVEPTSALVWQAIKETISDLSDPVVVILTGSGYKVRV
jgi:threonine synthase